MVRVHFSNKFIETSFKNPRSPFTTIQINIGYESWWFDLKKNTHKNENNYEYTLE